MTDNRLGRLQDILAQAPRERARAAPQSPQQERRESPEVQKQKPEGVERPAAPKSESVVREPRRRPARRSAPRRAPDGDPRRVRIPVRLDPDLHEALSRAARTGGTTLAAVAFEAIERAHDRGELAAVLAAQPEDPSVPSRRGSLFSRPVPRAVSVKTTAELRMSATDRDVLDGLVAEHRTTRTHLIESALRRHLLPGGGTR